MSKVLLDIARREHDRQVKEYRELERMLPSGLELAAIRGAATVLRNSGNKYVSDILDAYLDRLKKAGRFAP